MKTKTQMTKGTKQIHLTQRSPHYWRVTIDRPPLNIFGPDTIPQLDEFITTIETDENVKVVVFDSAVEGFFLTHYDFVAPIEHTTRYFEIAPEWDFCLASIMRPAAQERIKKLMDQGFHKTGDVENRLGYHVSQLGNLKSPQKGGALI